jgi:hypothetical protein
MKIRLGFVTNSSSTGYTVIVEKNGTDAEILAQLEKEMGWGKRGAEAILNKLEKPEKDDYRLEDRDDIEITDKIRVGYVTASDTENGVSIEDAIANKFFQSGKQVKGLKIIEVGEIDS